MERARSSLLLTVMLVMALTLALTISGVTAIATAASEKKITRSTGAIVAAPLSGAGPLGVVWVLDVS